MKKVLLLCSVLSACSLAPDYQRPETSLPANWRAEQVGEVEVTTEWWKKYGSEELNSFITAANANNKDLVAGLARIEQARAAAKVAGSILYPQIDGSASTNKTFDEDGRDPEGYRAGIDISYEVDLFGRNRSSATAAELREKATKFDYDALALITTADTATAYANYLSLNDRVNIAEKNLKNGQEILRIVQARYDAGKISALELSQQKTSLASLETAISGLKNQRDVTRNQLAILTGQPPQNIEIKGTTITELSAPAVKPIQPGELLERRPDIRSSEETLKAANMDIGTAKAAFYPNLQIGAGPGLAASGFTDPVDLAGDLVASLVQPIFTGGALEGNLQQSEARKKELAAQYSDVVLNALKEVEDSLSGYKSAKESLVYTDTAKTESQKAYDIAKIRYDEGRSDFQTLLDTQSSLFQTEDRYYQAKRDEVTASISLFKSLGGGWKE